MKKTSIAVITALLAACALTSPRNDPPDVTLQTSVNAEETVGCLVRELDAAFPGPAFLGGVAHHAVLIVPGQVYEVTPTRQLVVGGENYFVRVSATEGGSVMELFAPFSWVSEMEPAMQACVR